MTPTMYLYLLVLAYLSTAKAHREFQYNKPSNDHGEYNFAYDTGSHDAHSLRMEYRDDNGIVRGRYGYTDPWGKLRVVEYEAGPGGYKARGDVGPDHYLHGEAPNTNVIEHEGKLSPLRMAGWDAESNPIGPKNSQLERDIILQQYRNDHPEKGYDAPRPVEIVTSNLEKSYHVPKTIEIASKRLVQSHPEKGYVAPIANTFVEPPKVSHNVEKSYHVPRPVPVVVARTVEHHPEKGYDAPRPIALVESPKVAHHVEKSYHAPRPVPVVVTRTVEHHPEKGYDAPRPIALVESPKVAHHVEKSYHAPSPVPVVVARTVENHPEKGYDAPRPITLVESQKVAHHVEKSYHVPRPIAVVATKTVEHYHEEPKTVFRSVPFVERRVEHRHDKDYYESRAAHRAVAIDGRYHGHAARSSPLIGDHVDHHHHANGKNHVDSGYSHVERINDPIIVAPNIRKSNHHHSQEYAAEITRLANVRGRIRSNHVHQNLHEDVELIRNILSQEKNLEHLKEPLNVQNIDVFPDEIRIAAGPPITARNDAVTDIPARTQDVHIHDHSPSLAAQRSRSHDHHHDARPNTTTPHESLHSHTSREVVRSTSSRSERGVFSFA